MRQYNNEVWQQHGKSTTKDSNDKEFDDEGQQPWGTVMMMDSNDSSSISRGSRLTMSEAPYSCMYVFCSLFYSTIFTYNHDS